MITVTMTNGGMQVREHKYKTGRPLDLSIEVMFLIQDSLGKLIQMSEGVLKKELVQFRMGLYDYQDLDPTPALNLTHPEDNSNDLILPELCRLIRILDITDFRVSVMTTSRYILSELQAAIKAEINVIDLSQS